MMFRKTAAPAALSAPPGSFSLTRHRDELQSLVRQGYARRTIKTFRCMADRLCGTAETHGFGPDALEADGMR